MSHETLKLLRHEQFDPDEGEILVHFKYSAGRPMTMYRNNGDPGDPAEPDEIEILKIECTEAICGLAARPGADITDLITEAEYEYIENYLFENWQADDGDDDSDRWYRERQERLND
jgi:hypothetical protein